MTTFLLVLVYWFNGVPVAEFVRLPSMKACVEERDIRYVHGLARGYVFIHTPKCILPPGTWSS